MIPKNPAPKNTISSNYQEATPKTDTTLNIKSSLALNAQRKSSKVW